MREPSLLAEPGSFAVAGTNDAGNRSQQRRNLTLAAVAVGVVAVDQVSKAIALSALASGSAHFWILHLRLVANRGVFMGMISVPVWLIAAVTVAVVVVAVRHRSDRVTQAAAFATIAGGAVGNLVDRFLARPDFPSNAVVDWLSFGGSTFNLADAFLVGASVLLFRQSLVSDDASPAAESHSRPSLVVAPVTSRQGSGL